MRRSELALLMVVIAGLAAYLLMRGGSGRINYELPELPEISEGSVRELQVTPAPGGGEPYSLALGADGLWTLSPGGYGADPRQAANMAGKIEGLAVTAMVSEGGNHEVYELDEAHAIGLRAILNSGESVSLLIGKPTASNTQTFVRIGEGREVYQVRGGLRNAFSRSLDALRDRAVFEFDKEQVFEAHLYNSVGGGELHLARLPQAGDAGAVSGGRGRWRWVDAGDRPARMSEVDQMLTTLSTLRCDEYLPDAEARALGAPEYKVRLIGSGEYMLEIFGEREGGFVARASSMPYAFVISRWTKERIARDLGGLMGPMPGGRG